VFQLPANVIIVGGVLNVLADDSVSVSLNGTFYKDLAEPYSGPFNFQVQDTGSGPGGIGGGIPLSAFGSSLVPGAINTLTFTVDNWGSGHESYKGHGVASFGLSYELDLQFDPVPEPASVTLIPLAALGLLAWRRYAQQR
jgi:hypothetical protein